MDGDETSHKGALSPTTITDYFSTKKSSVRQLGKKTSVKKTTSSSVYLTPESSPGSHIDSDYTAKENVAHDDEDVATQAAVNADESTLTMCTAKEAIKSADSTTTKCLSSIVSNTREKIKSERPKTPESPSKSAIVKSESPRSPKKCSRQEKEEVVTRHVKSSEKLFSSPFYTIQTIESKTTSSSPCLPRLKLRKSVQAKSEVGATPVKEEEQLKPKPGRRKKKEAGTSQTTVITDFFPVRRSGRQTKSEIEKEKQHQLEQMILSVCEDGLEVKEFESKGRGVVATKDFHRGDFVVEYAGDLIDLSTAKKREDKYAKDPEIGCYMYYFKCGSNQYCVDATAESGRLGRLLNHSSKDGNCCTRSLEVEGTPRLILVAKRDIKSGEELTYDYGDRSKASTESHPWLKL